MVRQAGVLRLVDDDGVSEDSGGRVASENSANHRTTADGDVNRGVGTEAFLVNFGWAGPGSGTQADHCWRITSLPVHTTHGQEWAAGVIAVHNHPSGDPTPPGESAGRWKQIAPWGRPSLNFLFWGTGNKRPPFGGRVRITEKPLRSEFVYKENHPASGPCQAPRKTSESLQRSRVCGSTDRRLSGVQAVSGSEPYRAPKAPFQYKTGWRLVQHGRSRRLSA